MSNKKGIQSISEYEKYLKQNNVQINDLKQKIQIDAIWNEIIFKKFNSKVIINKEKIFNEVVKNPDKKFLLSEILFKSSNESQMQIKYQEIQADIKKEGFKNAALIHSISSSSTVGGEIGWFDKSSLNETIKKNISNLKIGDYSKPILTASGFLIIKIQDIKNNDVQANDIDNKVNTLIKAKTNQQLNQYSNIYYNKIKKDLVINEF
ncbi:peptidylprolyl isomerase [Pelagibacterales bacterium SAG-MED46]|nr:peptidylprolyl isomerase [Pelagibacterales bacterium SAG-MED46]